MAEQSEAGDIGERMRSGLAPDTRDASRLSVVITPIASPIAPAGSSPRFAAVVIIPKSQGLRENQQVARPWRRRW